MAAPAPKTAIAPIAARDLTRDTDLSAAEFRQLLALAEQVKRSPSRFSGALSGQYLSLLFEKPSLRTRMTFELAIKQLGGDCVVSTGPIAVREPVKDVARNLERWTGGIVARTFSQETIDELARWAGVPVVNALSDRYHPCQALADLFTIEERFGRLHGLKLAFIGDGNNVAHSLMLQCAMTGMDFAIATPPGYAPNAEIVSEARALASATGSHLHLTHDPAEAAAGAHGVYTDVWASMGQERPAEQLAQDFRGYQVNEALMSVARPEAVFLHCLPARRGQEVTDAVMESRASVVFDQAENRLHVQKALLLMLLS